MGGPAEPEEPEPEPEPEEQSEIEPEPEPPHPKPPTTPPRPRPRVCSLDSEGKTPKTTLTYSAAEPGLFSLDEDDDGEAAGRSRWPEGLGPFCLGLVVAAPCAVRWLPAARARQVGWAAQLARCAWGGAAEVWGRVRRRRQRRPRRLVLFDAQGEQHAPSAGGGGARWRHALSGCVAGLAALEMLRVAWWLRPPRQRSVLLLAHRQLTALCSALALWAPALARLVTRPPKHEPPRQCLTRSRR